VNAADEKSVSYWMRVPAVEAAPLERSLTVDVAVIGGGIAGTSAAYEAADRGLSVAILDRGELGRGMTARTSAHLSFQSDDLYQDVVAKRGKDIGGLHYESQRAAVDRIEAVQRAEAIDCDFARIPGFLALAAGSDASLLEKELEACRRVGFGGASLSGGDEIKRMKSLLALSCPDQARFHPVKYVNGVLSALRARGVHIHARTPVTDVDEQSGRVMLKLASGRTISAASAVIATNSPIEPRFAIHSKQAPYRTYVIAGRVPKRSVPDALYWDTADPYHYVRLQPEDDHDLLIVGGEDHRTGEAHDFEARFGRLEDWARARFPELGPVEYRWSGQVMEPIDDTAFIGKAPGHEHVYVVTGDSGQGLTHGALAGILIADLITGRPNAWAEVYAPGRKTLSAAGEYIAENIVPARNMAEHLTPGELSSPDELAPGQGGILRSGLEKLAVSRDRDGTLYVRSATCTHAGCVVHWNAFEQCWDCPCHGSHFAPDGTVLNGPAVSPLKAAELEPARR
jgi:glycine/D-amino acid oxidase-like deaminating enzyme/nitrite reductase/ring-hydroxylating ferredoxin subunit